MSSEHEQALMRITLYALEHHKFRDAWDQCVRDAADLLCAHIAGARMAGQVEGDVAYEAEFPVPHGMSDDDADLAFREAVRAAVEKRMNAMESPGGIG